MFGRWVEGPWRRRLGRPFVHVVLGARQTGKSTLLRWLWPDPAIALDVSDPCGPSWTVTGAWLDVAIWSVAARSRLPWTTG
jgi:hypothetical protein